MTGRIMIRVPIIAMRPEMPGQIINMGPEMRELNIIMAVRASHLRLRTAMQ